MAFIILCGENMNILILGGDNRQIYLTEIFKKNGFNAEHVTSSENLNDKINRSPVIVLPIPSTKDKITVYNSINDNKIYLSDLKEFMDNQIVLTCNLVLENTNCIDYGNLDEFAIKNAVPTAEGAIAIAVYNSEKTIFGSKCLVIGYGRIGKILSQMLKNLGANVMVSARKNADLSFITAFNMKAVKTSEINDFAEDYDLIFNTVNSPVIDDDFLNKVNQNALLIELASLPGGINANKEKAKCKIINAQGLPGKYSPFSAAKILFETIINVLKSHEGDIL